MFEARLPHAALLKKIIDSIKDLVDQANFDCTSAGIQLQAMDQNHTALVTLLLRADGFDHYTCHRNMTLGLNVASITKILKCVSNDDSVTIRAEDSADTVTFLFENQEQDKISEFELKLIDINVEQLGIPDTEYKVTITTPSSRFQNICTHLATIGDVVTITAAKDEVRFSANGEIGAGNITIRPSEGSSDPKKGEAATKFDVQENVSLAFALRYLGFFTKASPLASQVRLSMSKDVPLLVEYSVDEELGHVRYYLAPRIEDEDN